MSYLPHLALLAGIWALVVMSPGPDFVVTVAGGWYRRGKKWIDRAGGSARG